jgi:hypothetical protein
MALTRSRWLIPVLSACTASTLFIAPVALADDDHGGGDRGRGRGDDDARRVLVQTPAQTIVVERRDEDEDRDEDRDERVVVQNAAPLVIAINNEVANLMNGVVRVEEEDEDEVEVENVDVERVNVISLATLETGLSTADAATATAAVNNNRAGLLSFLNNGTAAANAIKMALTAAGVSADLSNLQAVLLGRGDRLIAVTA